MKTNPSIEKIMENIRTPKGKEAFLIALHAAGAMALQSGDFVAMRILVDMQTIVELDRMDKDYDRKLKRIAGHIRFYDALEHAKNTLIATGRSLNFDDSIRSLSEAVEQAWKGFEENPCPGRAADLLGLVECQNQILKLKTLEDNGSAGGEGGE